MLSKKYLNEIQGLKTRLCDDIDKMAVLGSSLRPYGSYNDIDIAIFIKPEREEVIFQKIKEIDLSLPITIQALKDKYKEKHDSGDGIFYHIVLIDALNPDPHFMRHNERELQYI